MSPPPTNNKKRKTPHPHPPSTPNEQSNNRAGTGAASGPPRPSKRAKNLSPSSSAHPSSRARTILAQSREKALNQNGELDVGAFVKAREFEIKALETSMKGSKRALTSRAFQQVPIQLRRRTASHNVKRVPKRLRGRAGREVSSAFFSGFLVLKGGQREFGRES